MRIDFNRVADVADIDGLHQVRLRVRHLGDFLGDHQVGILTGDANSLAALPVNGRDDFFIDLAAQDHLNNFDGGFVRDAQPVHKIGCDFELLQHARDLRTATVDDDGIDARLLEVDDVLRKGISQGLVDHGVTAELYYNRLFIVVDEVRDGLGQNARLQVGRGGVVSRGRSLGGRLNR